MKDRQSAEPIDSVLLRGRKALVTGGGRGIGRSIAIALAREGVSVAVLARSKDEVLRVAHEVGHGLPLVADVGRPDNVASAVAEAKRQLGTIDILVNNAGVAWPLGPTPTVDIQKWESSLAINLSGAVRLALTLLPSMLANGYGRILNLTTDAATLPGTPRLNAYSVAKAGVEMFTLNLAGEIAGSGVTVNAFNPGNVDTSMQEYLRDQAPEHLGEGLHSFFVGLPGTGGLRSPDFVAQKVVLLLQSSRTGEVVKASDI